MLPYIVISNKGCSFVPEVQKLLQSAEVPPDKLFTFSSNHFDAGMLPAADNHYYAAGNSALVVCGFIRHPDFVWDWKGENIDFFDKLLYDLQQMDAAAIRSAYTGSFTIFHFHQDRLHIFNTFSGLQPVYYHSSNGEITVSTSIIGMQQLVEEPVRDAGILQMTLNEWMETYTRSTLLENVYRLVSSEQLQFGADGSFSRSIVPFSVQYKPEKTRLMECVKEVWAGYKEIGKQFAGKNLEACMSLSGGVDSRTCLTSIYQHATKMAATNHGREDFYEYHRATDVAKAYNIPIYLALSADRMFPVKKDLEKYFLHDGGVVVEYDAIKDVVEKNNLPKIVVLGDLFETFKVDGTSVWEGRSNKQKTTLHLMFGGKMPLQTIEEYGFDKWVAGKVEYFMKKLEKDAPLLSDEMLEKYKNTEIKNAIRADFADWLNDFRHYGLKYVEDLNEVAYWLSKGRTAMWLQSSSCSGLTVGFTLFCTDKNLATVLSVPLRHKLRQRLHFYMFRLPDFKAIRRIPTPQIPYTPVTAPLPIKELVMYLRLKVDKMIGRRAAKKENPAKTRLLQSPNYKAEYNNKNLERYLEWYNDECVSRQRMKAYFKDIQEGRLGAVSTIDFIGLAKAEFMVKTCKDLVANPVAV